MRSVLFISDNRSYVLVTDEQARSMILGIMGLLQPEVKEVDFSHIVACGHILAEAKGLRLDDMVLRQALWYLIHTCKISMTSDRKLVLRETVASPS